MNKVPSTTAAVVGRIARLPDTPIVEIKALWRQLFATPLPTHNRQYLERRLAYRLQELALAQREPELLARNMARIEVLMQQTKPKAKAGRGERVRLVPGTVLTREFASAEHRVVALADGQFEYLGKKYLSLTAISDLISGTRWSGPAFFGLREKSPKKATK